jgi:hypothetical protein
MIDLQFVLHDVENSDIAAVSFEGTKTEKRKFREIRNPSKNDHCDLVPSKLTDAMSEFSKSIRTKLNSMI